jgi:anti-sigma regulatory factor (Ser/Thr protein kinase)
VNDDQEHVLRVPGVDLADLSTARAFVRRQLMASVPEDVIRDLELIASELVTNVWAHATRSSVNLGVSVSADRATFTVESVNAASWFAPDVADWTMAPPEQLTGRGLAVVRTVADGVDIDQRGMILVISAHRCLNTASDSTSTV